MKRFIQTHKNILLILIIILLTGIIFHLGYAYTIGKESNIISEVAFTDEDTLTYNDPALYEYVTKQLLHKNIILLKIKGMGNIKSNVETVYPFIDDMSISKVQPGKVVVTISFHSAELLFKNQFVSVAYSNRALLSVQESDSIISGAQLIELPDYFSGENVEKNSTGFLALMGPEKLKNDFAIIAKAISIDHILYLPGTQKSIIVSGNKKITFDHKRNISSEVRYLQTIQGLDTALYYEIDLTTFPTVIIKKQTSPFF